MSGYDVPSLRVPIGGGRRGEAEVFRLSYALQRDYFTDVYGVSSFERRSPARPVSAYRWLCSIFRHPWQPGAHVYGSAVCLRCGAEYVAEVALPTVRLLKEGSRVEETTLKQRFLVPDAFRGEPGVEPYRTAEKMAQDWIEEQQAEHTLVHKEITVLDHWLVEAEVRYLA